MSKDKQVIQPKQNQGNPKTEEAPVYEYNWDALKLDFYKSDFLKISDWWANKKQPQPPNMADKTLGWVDEKNKFLKKNLSATRNSLMTPNDKNPEIVRKKQLNYAQYLQLHAYSYLIDHDPDSAEDARKMMISGMEQERELLGMTNKAMRTPNLTQVNVNLPKTKVDELLDKMDVHQLLEFVAELKRERSRRALPKSSRKDQGEVK